MRYVEKKAKMIRALSDRWRRSGINEGDTMLIHSDIARTIIEVRKQSGVKIGPPEILESFIEAVGPSGTLLFPLFNFDFTKSCKFDIRKTPSQMGALTELVRKDFRTVRTGHPIYSFGVLGSKAQVFHGVDNKSAYAEDSPFGILRRLEGKIAVLDLPDSRSMTFYHHVEELERVDFRYFKDFSGQYTDENGLTSEKTYSIYVRDLSRNIVSNANPAGELLWKNGLYRGDRPKENSGLRTIRANDMFGFVSDLINTGNAEGNLFIYGEDE